MFDEDRDLAPEEFEKRPSLAFEKDFLRFMLSDGAGAMRVEPRPARAGLSLRLEWIVERSYANVQPACMYAGAEKRDDGTLVGWLDTPPAEWRARSTFGVKQDARQLNEHIVEVTVVQALADVRAATGLDVSTIDWFLPHYSSGYFRDKLAAGMARAGCAIDDARWFTNLERCGNTGSASIYIMLDELLRSGRVSRGQRLLGYVPESGRFSSGWFLATAVTADDA
jgi:3-oxoacyl-[acyl-carrier-protein] synthase-3